MRYDEEKKVGKKAEQMLETALLAKIGGAFKSHYIGSRKVGNKPLSESEAFSSIKRWQGNQGDIFHYLNKVVIRMARHGFVQHYGVDNTLRKAGERTRHKPRTTTYSFVKHRMNMDSQSFIDLAVEESNIFDYVAKEIARIRGEQMLVSLGKFLELEHIY